MSGEQHYVTLSQFYALTFVNTESRNRPDERNQSGIGDRADKREIQNDRKIAIGRHSRVQPRTIIPRGIPIPMGPPVRRRGSFRAHGAASSPRPTGNSSTQHSPLTADPATPLQTRGHAKGGGRPAGVAGSPPPPYPGCSSPLRRCCCSNISLSL